MPQFSGIDVVHSLKDGEIFEFRNIVIFTTSSDPHVLEEFKNCGAKRFLKSPTR
jgi:DNA-binding NarL/FixJ family response regulator